MKQRWAGEEVEVPPSVVRNLGGVVDVSIEANWSETQARLTSPKKPYTRLCMVLIPNHVVNPDALERFHQQEGASVAKDETMSDAGDGGDFQHDEGGNAPAVPPQEVAEPLPQSAPAGSTTPSVAPKVEETDAPAHDVKQEAMTAKSEPGVDEHGLVPPPPPEGGSDGEGGVS